MPLILTRTPWEKRYCISMGPSWLNKGLIKNNKVPQRIFKLRTAKTIILPLEELMPCTLTRFPGPLEEKALQHHETSTILTYRFWFWHSSFYVKPTLTVGWRKPYIFVSSEHRTWFQSKFQLRLANSRCLRLW